MDKREDKECYIRKNGMIGYGTWKSATSYERRAFELYMEIQHPNKRYNMDPISICTTKYDGSTFMAQFSKKSEGIYLFQEEGSDDCYEIMFCSVSLPCSLPSGK